MARKVRRGTLEGKNEGIAKKMLDWRLILGLVLIVYGIVPPTDVLTGSPMTLRDWFVTGSSVSLGICLVLRFVEKRRILMLTCRGSMHLVIDGQLVAVVSAVAFMILAAFN